MKTIKPIEKHDTCVYEFYDRDLKILTKCGRPAVTLYGNNPLCLECTKVVLSRDKSCKQVNKDGKPVKSIIDYIS